MEPQPMLSTRIIWGMFLATFILGMSSIFGSLCLVVYQVYWYLRLGEWPPFSAITGLRWLNVSWAFFPHDWQGAYTILEHCPLSVAIVILGCLPCSLVVLGILAEDN